MLFTFVIGDIMLYHPRANQFAQGLRKLFKTWCANDISASKRGPARNLSFPCLMLKKWVLICAPLHKVQLPLRKNLAFTACTIHYHKFAVKIQDSRSRPPPKYSHCVRMANFVEKIMPKSCRYIHIRGRPLIPWASLWPFLTTPSPTWASMSIWMPLSNKYVNNIQFYPPP